MSNETNVTDAKQKIYWRTLGISYIILVILILVNAWLKQTFNIVWANPIAETILLMYIPTIYMTINKPMTLKKNSIRNSLLLTSLFFFTIIIQIISSFKNNNFNVISNNKLLDFFDTFSATFLLFSIYAVELIRYLMIKNLKIYQN